jgi:hypothetical protein
MKRLTLAVLALLGGGVLASAARADQPLAGASLFAVSHGQPFCATRAELQALLDAQIAEAPIGLVPGCRYVEDNSIVVIGEDYRGGRYMHMVRAHANVLFGQIEGYTFSAGLNAYPQRSEPAHLNPFW